MKRCSDGGGTRLPPPDEEAEEAEARASEASPTAPSMDPGRAFLKDANSPPRWVPCHEGTRVNAALTRVREA